MAVITLQLGQCGNQVGAEFFNSLTKELNKNCATGSRYSEYLQDGQVRFFYENEKSTNWCARAVLIDMEPKVIQGVLKDSRKMGAWCYNDQQLVYGAAGSGNNWSSGYIEHGPALWSSASDCLQRELEKCDRLDGFVLVMSAAGGTGSGVGTYFTERIKEEFPRCWTANQMIWPFSSGEVAVQSYNCVLSLAGIYKTTDAVMLQENDELQKLCSGHRGESKKDARDLNRVLVHRLLSMMLPVESSRTMGSTLSNLTSHPSYKLLSIRTCPELCAEESREFNTFSWNGLVRQLQQKKCSFVREDVRNVRPHSTAGSCRNEKPQLTAGSCRNERPQLTASSCDLTYTPLNRSVGELLVTRGREVNNEIESCSLSNVHLYPDWLPSNQRFKTQHTEVPMFNSDKTLTLVSNDQMPVNLLDKVISRAWRLYTTKAYLHKYTDHGLTTEEFVSAFARMEGILNDYKTL